ncbi:MAG: hypothetical protein JF607_26465 [Burkholderiales bacterium]|jgi:hypothetical protein|nr:hypothetical protein [Burkholderiales bacterium]MBW8892311.1 hypothetical protein [Burkholderiales bacterium]
MRLSPDALAGLLRPPPPKPKQPTSRERAAANRLAVLRAVAAHGHLRCADLAAACWPGSRYGLQMAQRGVRGLVEAGELLARRNAHGSTSYVLTRPGAAALELHGVAARHGLDLASVSGPTYAHHALTARWCLHKQAQGFDAWSEYAVLTGQAPVSAQQLRTRLRKMPDAVLVKGTQLWLVETESAPKATAELVRIVSLAEHVGRRLHPELPYTLAGVVVLFDATLNHAARVAKAARERWGSLSAADQALLASRVTLAAADIGLPLVWRGCAETPLRLTPRV